MLVNLSASPYYTLNRTQYAGFNTQYYPDQYEANVQLTDVSGVDPALTLDPTGGGTWSLNGRMVTVSFKVIYPTTADTTSAKLGSLPFVCEDLGLTLHGGWVSYTDSGLDLQLAVGAGTSQVWPYIISTGIAPTNAQLSGKTIIGTVIYRIE
jgi:hypothetical protein